MSTLFPGWYEGNSFFDERGVEYRRLHAQIAPKVMRELADAGTPMLLEDDRCAASPRMQAVIHVNICDEATIRRNQRRTARRKSSKTCYVVELWESEAGERLMIAIEMGGPRDENLRYDVTGKGHIRFGPMFYGD